MAKLMSKSELIQKIANQHANGLTRKDIKGVIESLASVGYKELKRTGSFFVPGFAKFVVVKKPATKERKGINPFTKEPTIFKAPARLLPGLKNLSRPKVEWPNLEHTRKFPRVSAPPM